MADLTLYHAAPSRSSIVLWMLEEIGEPYDIKLVKLSEGDNLKPDYLAINPMGKVPALKDGEAMLGEAAAICAYIADRYPETGLAPATTAITALSRLRPISFQSARAGNL